MHALGPPAGPGLPPRPQSLPDLRRTLAPHRGADRPQRHPYLPGRRRPRPPAAACCPGPPRSQAPVRVRRLRVLRPFDWPLAAPLFSSYTSTFEAPQRGFQARGLRFAGWVTPPRRKTRFRVRVRLSRTGFLTRRVPMKGFRCTSYIPPLTLARMRADCVDAVTACRYLTLRGTCPPLFHGGGRGG